MTTPVDPKQAIISAYCAMRGIVRAAGLNPDTIDCSVPDMLLAPNVTATAIVPAANTSVALPSPQKKMALPPINTSLTLSPPPQAGGNRKTRKIRR